MRRQSQYISASTTVIFIMTVVISSYASASSLIHDPDDEAVIQRNRGILGWGDTETQNLVVSPYHLSSVQPRSPAKAFLFSAAVPGTGEFYSGAKRGMFFVAAEDSESVIVSLNSLSC